MYSSYGSRAILNFCRTLIRTEDRVKSAEMRKSITLPKINITGRFKFCRHYFNVNNSKKQKKNKSFANFYVHNFLENKDLGDFFHASLFKRRHFSRLNFLYVMDTYIG